MRYFQRICSSKSSSESKTDSKQFMDGNEISKSKECAGASILQGISLSSESGSNSGQFPDTDKGSEMP